MHVLRLTRPMRWTAALLLGLIPTAIAQVILSSRLPWWKIPVSRFVVVAAIATVTAVVLFLGLVRARPWARPVLPWVLTFWGFGALVYSYLSRSPGLGFLAIFILGATALFVQSVEMLWSASFMDPGVEWYQGLPAAISGVQAVVLAPSRAEPIACRLARLDRQGAFVFREDDAQDALLSLTADQLNLEVEAAGRKISIPAQVSVRWARGASGGLGLRFAGLDLPRTKELGDLVEKIRSLGHGT